MKDLEHARMMLAMAGKDLKALGGMQDTDTFNEEIFGFHIQQVAEKALKAWISLLGVEYPKTHDISLLLHLLNESGADVDTFYDLIEYNAFAVQFRYESFDFSGEPIDRVEAIRRVAFLVNYVEKLLRSSS